MTGAARVALVCGAAATVLVTAVAAQKPPARLGLGRAATPEEIRMLDIDVMPDGRGLPPGRGTVTEGATVYAAKCAGCHGPKGEGGSADRLVGRNDGDSFAHATNPKLIRTVGSYWPYATTLFDYTARAMPFQRPGTLTANETVQPGRIPPFPERHRQRRCGDGSGDPAQSGDAGARQVRAGQSQRRENRQVVTRQREAPASRIASGSRPRRHARCRARVRARAACAGGCRLR